MKFCKKCQCETARLPGSGNRCKTCCEAYRKANPDKLKAYGVAWRAANPKATELSKTEKFALYEAYYLANHPRVNPYKIVQ